MSTNRPKKINCLPGYVTKEKYGAGSKSERQAAFIETVEGRYILRRKTGPVFGDSELEKYVGHHVKCDGFIVGNTILAERIEIID